MSMTPEQDSGKTYAEIRGEAIHSNWHLRVLSMGLAGLCVLLVVIIVRLSSVERRARSSSAWTRSAARRHWPMRPSKRNAIRFSRDTSSHPCPSRRYSHGPRDTPALAAGPTGPTIQELLSRSANSRKVEAGSDRLDHACCDGDIRSHRLRKQGTSSY